MAFVVTNLGKAWLTFRLGGFGGGTFASSFFIGWGNGAGAPVTAADTTIFGEFTATGRSGATTSVLSVNRAGVNDAFRMQADIVAEASHTVDNAGVLDAATGGSLLLHASFTAIPFNTGDRLTLQFTVVMG